MKGEEALNHERWYDISKNIIRSQFPENHVGVVTNRTKGIANIMLGETI